MLGREYSLRAYYKLDILTWLQEAHDEICAKRGPDATATLAAGRRAQS